MRTLGDLSSIDLLEGVDTRALGVKGVHEMHGCGDLEIVLLVIRPVERAADWGRRTSWRGGAG